MERRFAPVVLALLLLSAQSPLPNASLPDVPRPNVPAAPPRPEPPAPIADELAFLEAQTRMTVPVQIAGAGPYGFVIDTGAQRTVISRELATRLGLARGRDVRLTAMTETSDVGTVLIPSISVSTLGGQRIEAPALFARDLGAPGMLGIDSLQRHALAIDFEKQTMAISPATRRKSRAVALPGEIVVRAKSLFGQLVVTDALADGKKVRIILDTGSAVTMGNLALQRRIARNRKPGQQIELVSVTGGVLNVDYGTLKSIRIGDMSINNMPIAYADAAPFRRFGLDDTPAILLGMDALKMFRRISIDFANRELRLLLPRDARVG